MTLIRACTLLDMAGLLALYRELGPMTLRSHRILPARR